jgi:hypothetical protein
MSTDFQDFSPNRAAFPGNEKSSIESEKSSLPHVCLASPDSAVP